MKMFKKLLFFCLALASMNVFAQTADEIVAKNIEAMGGAAKLASLTSFKKTGIMSVQGQDFPMTMTVDHMKGFRMDFEVMGTSNYQIITSTNGSTFIPIQQMTEPKISTQDELKEMQGAIDIHGALYNYKAKGITVEFVGDDKVDSADVYKLKVTQKSGKSAFYLIDKKSNRVVKTIAKSKGPDGSEMDVETPYGDYKQNADGYWFAHSTAIQNGMISIAFDKIETNVKIDESIFKD